MAAKVIYKSQGQMLLVNPPQDNKVRYDEPALLAELSALMEKYNFYYLEVRTVG